MAEREKEKKIVYLAVDSLILYILLWYALFDIR